MKRIFLLLILTLLSCTLNAQYASVDSFKIEEINWQNKDFADDKILGVSTEKAYDELLKDRTPKKTVIVAVIDGGVDIYHDDFKGKIWKNEDEIPDNNIDDDNNGYIDDIHGWNFLGNKDGENIEYENLEFTRILKSEVKDSAEYLLAEELYNEELLKQESRLSKIIWYKNEIDSLKQVISADTGKEINSLNDLKQIKPSQKETKKAVKTLEKYYKGGLTEELLNKYIEISDLFIDYFLNKEFNPREIVGDDPSDITDVSYGNNDVKGPRSEHGTGVAGIIAAVRDNNIGIDGIAANVKIMVLRAVPMGDERDKDIALAIKYAVDNGAEIINMSFGKDLSPYKEFVDDAVRYAEQQDVLLIHASGNDGVNIDYAPNFPKDLYLDGTVAANYLSIGASSKVLKKETPAIFSNYGYTNVDIFAPGVDIVTLDSNNVYQQNSGTSFAAPVVTGVAAMVLSYYPDLTSAQLIEILLESAEKPSKLRKVYQPDLKSKKRQKVEFGTLSKTGGIVNAYSALKLAEEMHTRSSHTTQKSNN